MIKLIRVADELPPRNLTVWFHNSEGRSPIDFGDAVCGLHKQRPGWHLGWHSGTRWHSLLDPAIRDDDSHVKYWCAIDLPPIPKDF